MEKVFLAIGHRQVEDYLKNILKNEFDFVGETVYREGIIKGIEQNSPNVIIVRETLGGNSNITEIIYNIRTSFPDKRIIYIAGKREAGDALLSTLVGYGIYDILTGEKINVNDIISLMRTPNQFSDVMHFQPKTTIDEKTNVKIFEAPGKIIEKVYIEKPASKTEEVKEEVKAEVKVEETKTEIKKEVNTGAKEEPKKEPKIDEVKNVVIEEPKLKETPKPVSKKENTIKETPIINNVTPIKEEPKEEPQVENHRMPFFKRNNKSLGEDILNKGTKRQILSFMGSKAGVGNSHVALNTALKLAQSGFKTIYIDLNSKGSATGYIYQIGEYFYGVDTSLKGIEVEDYSLVENAIITTQNIIKNTPKSNLMLKNYNKFPDKLSFMFFSHQWVQRKDFVNNNVNYSLLKDLYMYLTFQKEYDFIVLDVPSDTDSKIIDLSLIYATKIFCTITQDVSSISSNIVQLVDMSQKGINLEDKIYHILNKYENAILSSKDIENWISETAKIKANINSYIPDLNKEFIEANYVGIPVLLSTKNKYFLKAFSDIEKIIL